MRLFDLLNAVSWPEVESFLARHDPDAEESLAGYRRVFDELRTRVPAPSSMRLHVRNTDDQVAGGPTRGIVGRNGRKNKDLEDFDALRTPPDSPYALAETEYALELEAWDDWLGMEIDALTANTYAGAELAALCLYEMTFCGFDEAQVIRQREELEASVRELEQMSEAERSRNLIPLEQVMADIDAMLKSRS